MASWWLSTRFLEIRFLYPWLVWGTWRIATVPWCTQTDNLRTGQLLCRLPVNVCNTVRTQYQDVESSWIWTKRPYSKGTRLLFEIIAAIIIIQVHCDVDPKNFSACRSLFASTGKPRISRTLLRKMTNKDKAYYGSAPSYTHGDDCFYTAFITSKSNSVPLV